MDPELESKARELTIQELRQRVCETVHNYEDVLNSLVPNDHDGDEVNVNEWIENMKKNAVWVDHPFIQLMAHFLKRNIVIVTIHKSDGTNGSGKVEIEAQESNGSPLYLLNYDNIHFQSIKPIALEDSFSN